MKCSGRCVLNKLSTGIRKGNVKFALTEKEKNEWFTGIISFIYPPNSKYNQTDEYKSFIVMRCWSPRASSVIKKVIDFIIDKYNHKGKEKMIDMLTELLHIGINNNIKYSKEVLLSKMRTIKINSLLDYE